MRTIGITGGKGGTGKSTVATALASALAKKHRVLLVDADVDCPNDHLLLGIERKLHSTVEQRIPRWDLQTCTRCGRCGSVCRTNAIASVKGKEPIFMQAQCNGCGACVLECPTSAIRWDKKEVGRIYSGSGHHVELLSGELRANEPVSEYVVSALKKVIRDRKDQYDYVVIDTAAGTHCPVIAALEMCDLVYAVGEPTPLGRHDMELILQLLKRLAVTAGVILNRADIGDKKLITDLAKSYQTPLIADIPYSERIVRQYSRGEPIQEATIQHIADTLTEEQGA
jgi:MinD superfamily P-loop ATPase